MTVNKTSSYFFVSEEISTLLNQNNKQCAAFGLLVSLVESIVLFILGGLFLIWPPSLF